MQALIAGTVEAYGSLDCACNNATSMVGLTSIGHSITILGHPSWIDVFNAVFVAVAGMAIAALTVAQRDASTPTAVGQTVLVYVVGFAGVQYGAGFLASTSCTPRPPTTPDGPAVLGNVAVAFAVLPDATGLTQRLNVQPANDT